MISKNMKSEIIKKFAKFEGDTGSSEVQIAILSERINQINKHLEIYPKDSHSRLGLIKLVGKRRSLFNYLKKNNTENYQNLNNKLKEAGY